MPFFFSYRRILLVLFGILFVSASLRAQENLSEKVHTSIDKILDDHLAEVENTLIQEKEFDAKTILLVTVPLENFIEDVLFTINRPAVIYPRVIYRFIKEQFRQGKTRQEIERSLVQMQKQNKFERMYAEEKQQ
ncbi:MAG: hypothetical protein ACOYNS_14960 [Bacteroidota bacterium]